jgi:excisionase family DNA binding protein
VEARKLIEELGSTIQGCGAEEAEELLGQLEPIRVKLWRAALRQEPERKADERLLSIEQVAARLNVPKSRAYELCRRRDLPSHKVGKYIRVPASAVERYLTAHRKGAIDPSVYLKYTYRRHDRPGAETSSKTMGIDPAPASRKVGRPGQHSGKVGAGSPADHRDDATLYQAAPSAGQSDGQPSKAQAEQA